MDQTVRDNFDRLTEVCAETVWPTAAAIRMMKREAYPEGKSKRELAKRVKKRVEKIKDQQSPHPHPPASWKKWGKEHDWVFTDEDGRILHVDTYEKGGFSAAVRSLRRAGVRHDNIEVWIVPGSNWLEDLRGEAPDPGESIHDYDRPLRYDEWREREEEPNVPRCPPGQKKDDAPPRPNRSKGDKPPKRPPTSANPFHESSSTETREEGEMPPRPRG